ncbi:MAG: hypothetical protein KF778_18740 [Rhodocyclaceae bacterium]|nr:hypothetical protein [Rhodocyclaceae bacterium]
MDAKRTSRALSAEDLLAGSAATYTVDVPGKLLNGADTGQVTLRPLTVRDVQRVTQAAKEQHVLTSVLMVQQALVQPKLSVEETGSLAAGLLQFLLERVNEISGLSVAGEELEQAVKAPLARACFLLAREFGWTPAESSALTVGQILLYLEMLARQEPPTGA